MRIKTYIFNTLVGNTKLINILPELSIGYSAKAYYYNFPDAHKRGKSIAIYFSFFCLNFCLDIYWNLIDQELTD